MLHADKNSILLLLDKRWGWISAFSVSLLDSRMWFIFSALVSQRFCLIGLANHITPRCFYSVVLWRTLVQRDNCHVITLCNTSFKYTLQTLILLTNKINQFYLFKIMKLWSLIMKFWNLVAVRPDVVVVGLQEVWYVGQENVKLDCKASANPPAHVFLWTRFVQSPTLQYIVFRWRS